MKKYFAMFLGVIFLGSVCAVTLTYAAGNGPEVKTFETKMGAVTFKHKDHQGRAKDCQVCHHKNEKGKEEACSKCHDAKVEKDKASTLKDAMHKTCKGCHEKESKGPKECKGCHVKK